MSTSTDVRIDSAADSAAVTASAGIASEGAAFAVVTGITADNTASAGGAAFTDIDGHWAEAIIEEAVGLKIVGGYPDGTFRPDNLIKREEFYKLLTNILTVTPDTSNTVIRSLTSRKTNGMFRP